VTDFPPVPLTLEGSFVLHQFFGFDWKTWKALDSVAHQRITTRAAAVLSKLGQPGADGAIHSALYSQLGHKGDLLLVHFRDSLEALNQIELELAQTELYNFLDLRHSYVSVVEQGLYESSRKTYAAAVEKGFAAHSPEWNDEIAATLERQAVALAPRLRPSVPDAKYLCFYPMNRRRSEQSNWYTVPFSERQRMMHEHGMIGRRYANEIRQIITGSIGMDDWEWGVDLFSENPLSFKKIIYEMRFDEVSAVYGEFGEFFIALRLPVEKLGSWLQGTL